MYIELSSLGWHPILEEDYSEFQIKKKMEKPFHYLGKDGNSQIKCSGTSGHEEISSQRNIPDKKKISLVTNTDEREKNPERQLPNSFMEEDTFPNNNISQLPPSHHLPLTPSTRPLPIPYKDSKIKLNVCL